MSRNAPRVSTVSVLDIGSTKISCIIARLMPCDDMDVLHGRTHRIEVAGIGHQKSRGIKSGVVINLDEAEQIRNTQIAEELALPPVKIHCSVLAEDAIKAAVKDLREKRSLR